MNINLPISYTAIVSPYISRVQSGNWGQIHATVGPLTISSIQVAFYAHSQLNVGNIQDFFYFVIGF